MSEEILCRWKLFGEQWTKWFFPSWKAQENRSWINFEDLLRSLPILHFYSLHVRVLLTLMCRSAIFLPNASFSVSAFFLFWQSYFKTYFTVAFLPYSLHYFPLLQNRNQFLCLICCFFHGCNEGFPPCHWQLYVLCSITLFFQYTNWLPAVQLSESVSWSNELPALSTGSAGNKPLAGYFIYHVLVQFLQTQNLS